MSCQVLHVVCGLRASGCVLLIASLFAGGVHASDRLEFSAAGNSSPSTKRIVLVAGDEEYRTEESMPMLAKILSQKHGFQCTVLFATSSDDPERIDPNNSSGIRGMESLATADLMIIGTRFRTPPEDQAIHITNFLNAGKPVIGIRTATHAFRGKGNFGTLPYDAFGLKVLGETWVNHHGKHKVEGGRSVVESAQASHPILRGVGEIFTPSDIYTVKNLKPEDTILLRGAVTESLDPASPSVSGSKNSPMQPLAWLHTYLRPNGSGSGRAFCTTAGASVDFLDEDLRRLIVNAAYYLTSRNVPNKADVGFVDPFAPSFYGFVKDSEAWKSANLKVDDFALGKSTSTRDPQGTPNWPFRFDNFVAPPAASPQTQASVVPAPAISEKSKNESRSASGARLELRDGQRVAFVGSSLAERMNLFGYFETLLHTRFPAKNLVVRNFAWPADAVHMQQRPENYTKIDDPLEVFAPEVFFCFFGFNEHFDGATKESLASFRSNYQAWLETMRKRFTRNGVAPRFVLITPIAFESAGNRHLPDGKSQNETLGSYAESVRELAREQGMPFVDLFTVSKVKFAEEEGLQFTINGIHHNERGDRLIADQLDRQLFEGDHPTGMDISVSQRVRQVVNDKSWLHLQDYRMLNGWYVYGGRRTWDTETFPTEFKKIRKMVDVRDRYIWDLVNKRPVADKPDDSNTGEVFIPETMFGSRDEKFREKREPKTLRYPTPEESIASMKIPDGFEVKLFASEREFPELANPNQIAFDNRGRLWVSCMINYPQWLPGSAKPGDKLLILEDTDNDGKADRCKTFYGGLICPTGFEFFQDGVLVVDEPRILFLRDTDGDDQADEVTQIIDGIATDDTHHTMGAFEFSNGGRLYMLEGVSMSTTMETPWGPFRNKGPSGCYVLDPLSWKFEYFRTPGYGNPWCMVFDTWGQGIIGDGTNAQQHWTSPLHTYPVDSRRTLTPNFDNEGMRPAVGNEFLLSRHFPDDVQGQFIYACVINMHGLPRFMLGDETGTAGYSGKRIENLLDSPDNFFRPVDPQIGPDGALWFGDWCAALIGHMQYSQRDPNRDHEHGRIYRMVNKNKPLLTAVTQAQKSIPELLEQLKEYEPRTRYRARRELRSRQEAQVLAAIEPWISGEVPANQLCEAMWLQESFRRLNPVLVERIFASSDFHARAAAVQSVTNEIDRYPTALDLFKRAVVDEHPRVRLEAIRGLSFLRTLEAAEVALRAIDKPVDYWIDYTLEHALHAFKPIIEPAESNGSFLAGAPAKLKDYYADYKKATGPGGRIVKPLKVAEDNEAPLSERERAVQEIAGVKGGNEKRGRPVFERVCAACHKVGDLGKEFGPALEDVGMKYKKDEIIKHILWPNEKIAKGYQTVQVLTVEDEVVNGFVLKETDQRLILGTANGKTVEIEKKDIEARKEMNASSMPEGLVKTIAPSEFLDLLEYLSAQKGTVVKP